MIRACELYKASIFDFAEDDAGTTTIIETNITIGTETYEPVAAVAAAIRYWEKLRRPQLTRPCAGDPGDGR